MIAWRWGNVPLEVVANLRANRVRHTVIGLLVAVATATLLFSELDAAQSSLDSLRTLDAAGRSVYVAEPVTESGSPLLGSAICDNLARLPQVRASGGLSLEGFVEFESAPGTPLRLYLSTGSFERVVDPNYEAPTPTSSPNVLVAREAMAQAGLRSGSSARLRDGREVVVHSFDPGGRHPLGALMVVASSHPQLVDQCWFELRNADLVGASELAQAAFTSSNLKVSVRSAQEVNVFTKDPIGDFLRRHSRYGWLIFGLVIAAPGLLVMWFSRQNAALYRSLRAGRLVVCIIVAGEAVAVVLWGTVLGSSIGLITALQSSNVESASAVIGLRAVSESAALATMSTVVGGVLATRGRLTDQLKDR